MKHIFLACAGAAVVLHGCAALPNKTDEPEPVKVETVAPAPEARPDEGAQPVSPDDIERELTTAFDRIHVELGRADVSVSGGWIGKKGKLKVRQTAGGGSCRVLISEEGGMLAIKGPQPPAPAAGGEPCRYSIEIQVYRAAELNVELKRGSVLIENWNRPAAAKLELGDVDAAYVGDLSVRCGRCTLSGEGVSGNLKFQIEHGNVGLAGLSGSVEGQTLGDTVLKWGRLKPGSSVKVSSKGGDVILFFPEGVPLAVDLKAPRGEVYSRHRARERGIPVSVTAALGNVRLFRSSGSQLPIVR